VVAVPEDRAAGVVPEDREAAEDPVAGVDAMDEGVAPVATGLAMMPVICSSKSSISTVSPR